MTSKIPPPLQIEVIDLAEKELRKGKSPTSISKLAQSYLKERDVDVSSRTILRLLEKRDRKVASAINTIVSTTLEIDLDKPREKVDSIVAFLYQEFQKSITKEDITTSSFQRQKEIVGWLDALDRYIEKQIKISTLTSAKKEDTKQESISEGKIVVTEDCLPDGQE